MTKRNKLALLIISELTFLATILIVLPSIFIKERPGVSQTSYNDTLSLDTKNSFSQEFTSDKNNLRSISVLLKNPGLVSKDQIKIELQDQSKVTLRHLETSGISIGDPSWVNFEFPYINSQKGDKFFIKISTNNQQLDHLYVYGNRQSKDINFKTTYTARNLKESFQNNIEYQKNQIHQRSFISIISYLTIILLLNIFFSL